MFKYNFAIKTTFLESLRNQSTYFRARFRQTRYKDLVFERGEFSRFFGAPNESVRLIIIYYMFKNTFGNKTILLQSLWNQKIPLKARFRQN